MQQGDEASGFFLLLADPLCEHVVRAFHPLPQCPFGLRSYAEPCSQEMVEVIQLINTCLRPPGKAGESLASSVPIQGQ